MRIIVAACLAGLGLGGVASLTEPERPVQGVVDHTAVGANVDRKSVV